MAFGSCTFVQWKYVKMPETGKMSRKIELPLHSVAIKGDDNCWVFASNGTFESSGLVHLLVHLEFLVLLLRAQAFSSGASRHFLPMATVRFPKWLCVLDVLVALYSGCRK